MRRAGRGPQNTPVAIGLELILELILKYASAYITTFASKDKMILFSTGVGSNAPMGAPSCQLARRMGWDPSRNPWLSQILVGG
jgi:hypothetical protein